MIRKILVITLVICMLLQALAFTASAASELKAYEVTTSSEIEKDLSNMLIGGKTFSEADFPINEDDSYFHIIRFLEMGFNGTTFDDDAGIFVFIYNPSLQSVGKSSTQNCISMQIGSEKNLSGFNKYKLIFCDSSDDDRFLKYRVDIDLSVLKKHLSSNQRKYEVSEIELYFAGLNATAFNVAGKYTYTGTGTELYCTAEDMFTIELDITGTFYRPDVMSSGGADHRNEIESVYFSVPNSVRENYGNLYRVQGEYYENQIVSVITENKEYFDAMLPIQGRTIGVRIPGYGLGEYDGYSPLYPGLLADLSFISSNVAVCKYGINASEKRKLNAFTYMTYSISNQLKKVPYLFYVEDIVFDEVAVRSEELKERVEQYGLVTLTGEENTVKTSYSVSVEDGYELKSFASTHSDFETFVAKIASWWQQDLSTDVYIESAIEPIDPSALSLKSNENAADFYFVDKNDIPDLRNKCSEAAKNDETVYLLRFAQSEAATYKAEIFAQDSGITVDTKKETYLYSQTYYKDFDVLSLTFGDESRGFTVLGVKADPIDQVGDITLTNDFPLLPEDWWKYLIAIVMVVVLVIVLVLAIRYFFKKSVPKLSQKINKDWEKFKSSLKPKRRQRKRRYSRNRKYSKSNRK
ncbi:MAG: hypothetical protein IKC26_05215 [Clostridia bacterium]|nr:hypothetical protein [Clostridia bacterium]